MLLRHTLSATFLVLCLAAPAAHAQRGTFGIGGQLGDPTGVALKFGSGSRTFDLAAGWDLNDYLFVQGHLLLREARLQGEASDLHYFYGPGLFLGVRDGNNDRDGSTAFGASFNAGLSYYTGQLEFFGQLTPRLRLIDNTDFDIGGALGLRYYP